MIEEIQPPLHKPQPRLHILLRRLGFIQGKGGPRLEFQQWHRNIGNIIEYFADVYAKGNWVELYTRPRNGRQLMERFAGTAETDLDVARLLWQCQFITDSEWAAEQRKC